MGTKVDTRLSPSLHPGVIGSVIESVPAEHRTALAPVVESARVMVSAIYADLGRLHDLHDKLSADETRTPAARTLELSKAAESVFKRAAAQLDARTDQLRDEIASLAATLAEPLQPKPGDALGGEIRAFLRGLPDDKRVAAVAAAVDSGDTVTAIAALSAPGYLVGLSTEMKTALTAEWHRRQNPAAAARLEALTALRDKLMAFGALLFGALQRAVGADPRAVESLRAKADAASAAVRAVTAPAA
ncbi:MAG: hypothetical protein AMXMBFR26_22240 [Porticoccaceae bacterium]